MILESSSTMSQVMPWPLPHRLRYEFFIPPIFSYNTCFNHQTFSIIIWYDINWWNYVETLLSLFSIFDFHSSYQSEAVHDNTVSPHATATVTTEMLEVKHIVTDDFSDKSCNQGIHRSPSAAVPVIILFPILSLTFKNTCIDMCTYTEVS